MIRAMFLSCLLLAGCVTTGGPEPRTDSDDAEAAEINVQLGATYMQQGKLEQARNRLERALEQNPELVSAHTYAALLYDQLGDAKLAEKHYRRALRLNEKDPGLLNLYGAFLCRNERVSEAEEYFLAATRSRLYKTPEAALTNAGVCQLRVPDTEAAESYFRQALDANPRFPDALWQMARLSFDRQVFLQARAFFERYASVSELTPESLWLGVRIERELGGTAEADEYARQLRTNYPTARETRLLIESERDGGSN